jgi:hypothetical protein
MPDLADLLMAAVQRPAVARPSPPPTDYERLKGLETEMDPAKQEALKRRWGVLMGHTDNPWEQGPTKWIDPDAQQMPLPRRLQVI